MSRKPAAYNYTSSLALLNDTWVQAVGCKQSIQKVRVQPATRSANPPVHVQRAHICTHAVTVCKHITVGKYAPVCRIWMEGLSGETGTKLRLWANAVSWKPQKFRNCMFIIAWAALIIFSVSSSPPFRATWSLSWSLRSSIHQVYTGSGSLSEMTTAFSRQEPSVYRKRPTHRAYISSEFTLQHSKHTIQYGQ